MIQVSIISGKGGTGKTMLTAALADIIECNRFFADCDVDASNLELVLSTHRVSSEAFKGMERAYINPSLCIACGTCKEKCRFDAVYKNEGIFICEPLTCEGCGVCMAVCPEHAITMIPRIQGKLYYSITTSGNLSHAFLKPGSGNSGLLVHDVKKKAVEKNPQSLLFLIDGPPGIGCPVMSTITGTDAAIIVVEPSISAFHDLERVVNVCRNFSVQILVVINRWDISTKQSDKITHWCNSENIQVIGRIPFDESVIESIRRGIPITHIPGSQAAKAIHKLRDNLMNELVRFDDVSLKND